MPFDATSHSTWVSADALSGCMEVAADVGFDVRPYLLRHGIDPGLVENSSGLLPYAALNDCLEDVATSEGCADFGFRLGQTQKPLQFGMISQILQFAPTVGEAIRIFLRYRDFYSQSSYWGLGVEQDIARLRRQGFGPTVHRSTQITILSVTRGFEAIRSLMGPEWAPIGIYLSTDEVAFSAAMRRFFRAPVFFNAQYDEIAFEAHDLEQQLPTANAEILIALTSHFDRMLPELNDKGPVSAQVQKQISLSLEAERCTLANVAAHFGMHPRTLQRALANEGSSFRKLEQEARMSIAQQIVETSRTQLAAAAAAAGYRHQSSFSRAYKRRQGETPRASRASIRS